ncbi:hypothetical protein PV620_08260 [Streptomyces sp. ME02-6978a]|uniref:hypothetical protein n=1 Tax=unclassified Streptomyces TaxID=2593676 RepID=UPI0029B424F3|nr:MULTISPECIES: hypothetical protein [unclassified Streptomyces]MDX3088211.1 hypothetical protein [Streptomyces sp. ME12-02E]MDX3331567.1 hypothetical protein [Streptomyces sp. ME02-6978a]
MTEKLLSPLRNRPVPERLLTRLLGAGVAAAAYLLCLPWDLRNRAQSPDTLSETTPVTAIGVVSLILVLAALAAYFGRRDGLGWIVPVVAAPPAALMLLSFRSHPEPDASAWPLAWAFFTVVGAVGVLVVGAVARSLRPEQPEEWLLTAR